MKLKSIFKVLSTLSLAFTLTACSNTGTTQSETATTTEAKPIEKTVIEYWHVNAETQGGKTVEELVKAFNEQSETTEVIAKFNPDMYKGLMQNLQAEAAAGKSPAVV